MNYYISDLHFDHKRSISFDNRPFFDLEDMKNSLINNWNSVVTKNDDVYVLGDFFWHNDRAIEILSKLNGHIHLIKGNHDKIDANMVKYFTSISEGYKEIKDNGNFVVLSHFPIAFWRNLDYGWIHLFGHVHNSRDYKILNEFHNECKKVYNLCYNAFNVGCMLPYMDYTPRTLSEIINANGGLIQPHKEEV